jgi:hypothetical protein
MLADVSLEDDGRSTTKNMVNMPESVSTATVRQSAESVNRRIVLATGLFLHSVDHAMVRQFRYNVLIAVYDSQGSTYSSFSAN